MLKKILVLIIAYITLPTFCMNENEKKFFKAVQQDSDISAIQSLVKGGVNIDTKDENGNTALMIAVQKGCF